MEHVRRLRIPGRCRHSSAHRRQRTTEQKHRPSPGPRGGSCGNNNYPRDKLIVMNAHLFQKPSCVSANRMDQPRVDQSPATSIGLIWGGLGGAALGKKTSRFCHQVTGCSISHGTCSKANVVQPNCHADTVIICIDKQRIESQRMHLVRNSKHHLHNNFTMSHLLKVRTSSHP